MSMAWKILQSVLSATEPLTALREKKLVLM